MPLLAFHGAYAPGRLIAVHYRHVAIHQDQRIRSSAMHAHGILAVHRAIRNATLLFQQAQRNFAVHRVIVRHEDAHGCCRESFSHRVIWSGCVRMRELRTAFSQGKALFGKGIDMDDNDFMKWVGIPLLFKGLFAPSIRIMHVMKFRPMA